MTEIKLDNIDLTEREFKEKIWPQYCGDSLRILDKNPNRKGSWICEFINKPWKIKAQQSSIVIGCITNPLLISTEKEFRERTYLQSCGDILEIISKTYIKKQDGTRHKWWKCKFKNHPYESLQRQDAILNGQVNNPKILEDDFIGKIYPQNCFDSVKVLRKTEKRNKIGSSRGDYLFEVEFQEYPYKKLATKQDILRGTVDNPRVPYNSSREELTLRKFIEESFPELEISKYSGNEEDHYWEIDIYIPSLKLGFEYNGSYWHREEKVGKTYHEDKVNYFLSKGIQIYHIWDYFWWGDKLNRIINEEAKDFVKNIINNFLNK